MPEGAKAVVDGRTITIEGPKGKVGMTIDATVSVEVDNAKRQIHVKQSDVSALDARGKRQANAMWGTTFRLIQGVFTGVTKGYEQKLLVVGVGYSARLDGQNLVLRCGYANELKVLIPEGIKVAAPEPGNIMISGIGQVPAVTLTV
ncbi:MAG: 50S ribosomal protein L6, partial [Proteobacteria bacterium]|nr:50S ribosomal protein L6 [Pseudomonadota bacterium]